MSARKEEGCWTLLVLRLRTFPGEYQGGMVAEHPTDPDRVDIL